MVATTYLNAAWSDPALANFAGSFLASDPTILVEDGIFRMFYTEASHQGTDVRPGIAQAVSADGKTWTQLGGNVTSGIVLTGGTGDQANIEGACIFRAGDTYILLYSTYPDVGDPLPQFPAKLHAAVSTDGLNFTPVSNAPVLSPTPGWFDNDAVYSPTVIAYGGGYLMLYCGHAYTDASGTGGTFGVSLLAATSPDGINWTKGSTQILGRDLSIAWMSEGVAEPSLILGPNGECYLFFTGIAGDQRSVGYAVATNPFGPWEIAPLPIITAQSAGLGAGGGVIAPHAALVDGVLRLWYTEVTADGLHSVAYVESNWGGGSTGSSGGAPHWLGTGLDDVIAGTALADKVTAAGGNDVVATDAGNDTVDAGDGDDEVWAGDGADSVIGGTGNDRIYLESGADTVDAGHGADIVSGDAGADLIHGGTGDDTLDGGADNDRLEGGDGNDVVYAGTGADSLVGGAGQDTLNGGHGADTLRGDSGADLLISGEEDDSSSNNMLFGGDGHDILMAFGGKDTLDGGADNDTLYAGANADTLSGGLGTDALYGEDGDDRLIGGALGDLLAGGAGADTADYSASTAVVVALDGSVNGTGDAAADILVSIENIVGSATGADRILGDALANRLDGLAGNDTLEGGSGSDTLTGDAGNDWLFGGAGRDYLNGGRGADRFLFKSLADSGPTVVDADTLYFMASEGDRIDVSAIDANALVAGNQAFAFIGSAAFSAPGQIRYASKNLYLSVDADADAEMVLLTDGFSEALLKSAATGASAFYL